MNEMLNTNIATCMALISNLYDEINNAIDIADENLDDEAHKVLCSLENLQNEIINLNLV